MHICASTHVRTRRQSVAVSEVFCVHFSEESTLKIYNLNVPFLGPGKQHAKSYEIYAILLSFCEVVVAVKGMWKHGDSCSEASQLTAADLPLDFMTKLLSVFLNFVLSLRLSVFENRIARKEFGREMYEVTGYCKRLRNVNISWYAFITKCRGSNQEEGWHVLNVYKRPEVHTELC